MWTENKELKEMSEIVFDLFFPRRCPICDDIVPSFAYSKGKIVRGGLIHRECAQKPRLVKGATCMKCGKPLIKTEEDEEYCLDCKKHGHYFDRGFSLFEYRSISGSIYRFKYEGRREYSDYYADITAKRLGKRLKNLGIEAIIPVPMYDRKRSDRGYNQAEVYSEKLSERLGIPTCPDVIKRVKSTVPMKGLDARARRNNLKKAFNIVRNDVKFKCILIIDDIYTTGSTVDEIAHEFRMTGVDRIYVLTLAIGQTT